MWRCNFSNSTTDPLSKCSLTELWQNVISYNVQLSQKKTGYIFLPVSLYRNANSSSLVPVYSFITLIPKYRQRNRERLRSMSYFSLKFPCTQDERETGSIALRFSSKTKSGAHVTAVLCNNGNLYRFFPRLAMEMLCRSE